MTLFLVALIAYLVLSNLDLTLSMFLFGRYPCTHERNPLLRPFERRPMLFGLMHNLLVGGFVAGVWYAGTLMGGWGDVSLVQAGFLLLGSVGRVIVLVKNRDVWGAKV